MNKFIETLKNIWKIKELRNKILFTIAILAVYRLGSFIPIPGVDPVALDAASAQGGGNTCLLYTSPSPRDKRQSRMPSSA